MPFGVYKQKKKSKNNCNLMSAYMLGTNNHPIGSYYKEKSNITFDNWLHKRKDFGPFSTVILYSLSSVPHDLVYSVCDI